MPDKDKKARPPIWVWLVLIALLAALIMLPGEQEINDDLTVTMLDVGQADAVLIQNSGKYMLIDAGKNDTAAELVETVKSYGVIKLDIVIGTHPHEDHIGGLDDIIYAFEIDILLMPDAEANTKTYRDVVSACKSRGLEITVPEAGEQIAFSGAEFTVIAPNSAEYKDLNNCSIVVRLVYVSTSFLFTGDAEALSEREILDARYDIKADVLKVGHHGSSTSTSPAFLKAVNPEIALISCGAGNSYGHPHREILDALRQTITYRTDMDGAVTLVSDGYEVKKAA